MWCKNEEDGLTWRRQIDYAKQMSQDVYTAFRLSPVAEGGTPRCAAELEKCTHISFYG